MRLSIITDTHWGFSTAGDKANVSLLKMIGEKEKPDVLLHCGDDGSHCPGNIDAYWAMVRTIPGLETIPIYVTPGNHTWWADPQSCDFITIDEMIKHVDEIYKKHNIKHLHGDIESVGNGVYIGSMDSWYHSTKVPTNDWRMTPGLSGFGSEMEWRKLQKRSLDGFSSLIEKAKGIKVSEPESKLIMITHMGFIKADADSDWKAKQSGIYFGTTPQFEDNIEDFDFIFYGHSHQYFEGVASNGKTKVLNVGSDYEHPEYATIEV